LSCFARPATPFQHLAAATFWRQMAGMNPNPHVLIVVEKPNEKEADKWNVWTAFSNELRNNPQLWEAGECLTEGVWQFPVTLALLSVNRFLAKVHQNVGLNSKMFYSESKLEACK
jgi:hypothetical protein